MVVNRRVKKFRYRGKRNNIFKKTSFTSCCILIYFDSGFELMRKKIVMIKVYKNFYFIRRRENIILLEKERKM